MTVSSDPTVAWPTGDGNEPNRKDLDGGTIKSLPAMPVVPSAPPDPKLNLGEVSAPGVSLDVVTVSKVPMLSRLSVDNVQETYLQVASPDALAGYVTAW